MLGLFSSEPPANVDEEQTQVEEVVAPTVQTTFFEIPDLIVNLNTSGRKSVFLKIKISLEIADPADIDTVNQLLPRVVDNFQVYLENYASRTYKARPACIGYMRSFFAV